MPFACANTPDCRRKTAADLKPPPIICELHQTVFYRRSWSTGVTTDECSQYLSCLLQERKQEVSPYQNLEMRTAIHAVNEIVYCGENPMTLDELHVVRPAQVQCPGAPSSFLSNRFNFHLSLVNDTQGTNRYEVRC